MFDFENILTNGEKILYQGKANSNVVSKKIFGELFVIAFVLVIQILVFIKLNGCEELISPIMILATTFLFDVVCGYSIIYKLFLKRKKIVDDLYCLTNIRVIKYDINENKLSYGFLANYSNIYVCNVKNGYGDIYMEIVCRDNTVSSQTALKTTNNLIKLVTKPNLSNMPFIGFESIFEPDKVLEIIVNAKKELNNVESFNASDLSNFISE